MYSNFQGSIANILNFCRLQKVQMCLLSWTLVEWMLLYLENYSRLVGIFSPNETELARLTGMPTGTIEQISQAAGKCHEMVMCLH
jgi:sugar/nucleoside kinase (ribokinase family)